jgi:two-component sensor histidine kinase
MATKQKLDPMLPDLSRNCLEHAPLPMAMVVGAMHIVRYANNAFCRLADKTADAVVGEPYGEIFPERPQSLEQLDRVYRSGQPESYTLQNHTNRRSVFQSLTMWPVMADENTVGVMIQVTESAPLYERALAMNEALILGSLRQHELAESANSTNTLLQTEVGAGKQRELDGKMLANEISHRIKNNLQIIVGLIGHEARQAPAPCAAGYQAMQARIGAIAKLYDLISQASHGRTVPVDAYLREIAKNLSTGLLGKTSRIEIEVEAEALEIDPDRAVAFGLLVNELTTNAIKHAFPADAGRVALSARLIGREIELVVADNGVGMGNDDQADTSQKHGADYVAIFARQLGGTLAVSGSEGNGTEARIRFPLLMVPRNVIA